jgi:thioester reductase-like protein
MINLIDWQTKSLVLKEGERVLQFAALSFDVAFQEIFTTICAGGTLVLLEERVRRDARALLELLRTQSIERLFVPPMMLQSLAESCQSADDAPHALRDVITAGEQLRVSSEVVSFFRYLEGCRLHNHYGPTETHVVTALTLAGDPAQWPAFPALGRPIFNTQIHLLDGRNRPVPLGVVGEIYIGGANVATSYLKRPRITAQRFIPDPFGAPASARLYKTGDLGRWQPDGVLEYLGRNDDQVKVRGFRIELGEIEEHLTRHPQVKDAAVLVREDRPGEKRLVAYLSERSPGLRIEELRFELKALLPEYMVPSAFVTLEHLPLTPSGKLDRRALPVPDFDAYTHAAYMPPQGETEQAVARIWQDLLHIERIGRDDDVFELGGHSLLALKALLRINEACGCNLRVADIYTSPTVRELAAKILGSTTRDDSVDLGEEAALDEQIVARAGIERVREAAVLLTGATGFVGRFLLSELIRSTDAAVYCLVRAGSPYEASQRLRENLKKWDLWSDELASRIEAIPGDLRSTNLGLSAEHYDALSKEIDTIYHCGTRMNHLETYAMAKSANVGSAKEILKFATQTKLKLINHISTLGVFNATPLDNERIIDETSPIENELHWNSRGHMASKWVADKMFLTAKERGFPCNIFRLGLMWADSEGRFDERQHVYRLIKTCLMAGVGIKDYRFPMPPLPVDHATRGIVELSRRHPRGSGVFHIASHEQQGIGFFERTGEIVGTSLGLLPYYEWLCEIKRLHFQGQSFPMVPLVEFAFSMDKGSFEKHQSTDRSAVNVRFDFTHTHQELARAGIEVPVLNDALIDVCIRGMLSRDEELRVLMKDANRMRGHGLEFAKFRKRATSN